MLDGLDPRASGLLTKGGARRLSSVGESQKVWKCPKLQGLSHSGSRWRGRGGRTGGTAAAALPERSCCTLPREEGPMPALKPRVPTPPPPRL